MGVSISPAPAAAHAQMIRSRAASSAGSALPQTMQVSESELRRSVTIPPPAPMRSSRQSAAGDSSGNAGRPSIMRSGAGSPTRASWLRMVSQVGTAPGKRTVQSSPITSYLSLPSRISSRRFFWLGVSTSTDSLVLADFSSLIFASSLSISASYLFWIL